MKTISLFNIKIWGAAAAGGFTGTITAIVITRFLGQIDFWLMISIVLLVCAITTIFLQSFIFKKVFADLSYLIKNTLVGKKIGGPATDDMILIFEPELHLISEKMEALSASRSKTENFNTPELNKLFNLPVGSAQPIRSMLEKFSILQGKVIKSLEQLTKIITINRSISSSAEKMNLSTEEMANDTSAASKTASEGIKSVGHEIRAISDLKSTMGSSAQIIEELNEMSRHVSQFINTIATISRRTELLALNAGIEAARAGEAGKGFSVVANEIRTLSESSKKATEEIGEMIREIDVRTGNAISAMRTTNKLEENIRVVYAAGDTFMHIVTEVKSIDKVVSKIKDITVESSNDSLLLNKLLERLSDMLQECNQVISKMEHDASDQNQIVSSMVEDYEHFRKTIHQVNVSLESNT